jgi:hypothetical protein
MYETMFHNQLTHIKLEKKNKKATVMEHIKTARDVFSRLEHDLPGRR